MVLDVIAEVVIKTLGRFLLEIVFLKIFYWPGWLMLRSVTAGHYPPKTPTPHSEEFVGMFGFAVILVRVLMWPVFAGGWGGPMQRLATGIARPG